MVGYDFHPEARLGLDEIWEFIGVDSLAAADRLVAEIFNAVRALVPFPHQAHVDDALFPLFQAEHQWETFSHDSRCRSLTERRPTP
jgi:plasmid stabilization system protein ParE